MLVGYFIALSMFLHAQVVGGAGICHTTGDPDNVSLLQTQLAAYDCLVAYDTLNNLFYKYHADQDLGDRWEALTVVSNTDTRIQNPKIVNDDLKFDLIDVVTNAVISSESVHLFFLPTIRNLQDSMRQAYLAILADADGDPTNELQDLQGIRDSLINAFNAIAADADGDPTNELQDLQGIRDSLINAFNAIVADADGDPTNELQDLQGIRDSLINAFNAIAADADSNPNNEIQLVSLLDAPNGVRVILGNNGGEYTIGNSSTISVTRDVDKIKLNVIGNVIPNKESIQVATTNNSITFAGPIPNNVDAIQVYRSGIRIFNFSIAGNTITFPINFSPPETVVILY